jgi:hypothetical protein
MLDFSFFQIQVSGHVRDAFSQVQICLLMLHCFSGPQRVRDAVSQIGNLDRLYLFEVSETNEQEETVTWHTGFEVSSLFWFSIDTINFSTNSSTIQNMKVYLDKRVAISEALVREPKKKWPLSKISANSVIAYDEVKRLLIVVSVLETLVC